VAGVMRGATRVGPGSGSGTEVWRDGNSRLGWAARRGGGGRGGGQAVGEREQGEERRGGEERRRGRGEENGVGVGDEEARQSQCAVLVVVFYFGTGGRAKEGPGMIGIQ
jgi:hypothetical protein